MVHNIHINIIHFYTFYRISYGKLNIQKFFELVYQLELFNKILKCAKMHL